MSFDFVPANLAIKAMRSNGFKSTDYAVSELIDNSIQAGMKAGNKTSDVEVICIESRDPSGGSSRARITEIVIADNSGGMSPKLLRQALMFGSGTNLHEKDQKGIGKFGMGLPNSSISQCKLTEVYSWQNGACYKTSLDVKKIEDGDIKEVPDPEAVTLPEYLRDLSPLSNSAGGTIVVWKVLDKTTWTTHQGFFRNSEFLVGRMYRKFINNGDVKIVFKAYLAQPDGTFEKKKELIVRPNDPLMLMTGTSAPAPFDREPAFEALPDSPVTIDLPNGKQSVVIIKASVASQRAREPQNNRDAGSLPHGQYAARNNGVSIVRAGRELDLNTSWVKPGDVLERWWGLEINFEPELDEIFGVTNNKQAATHLYKADAGEDAENLGIKKSQLLDDLYESGDFKQHTYKISGRIDTILKSIRNQISRQREGTRAARRVSGGPAEQRASEATAKRAQEGYQSSADKERASASVDERKAAIESAYIDAGMTAEQANRVALAKIEDGVRFNFVQANLNSPAIFDISFERGEYFVKFNNSHPAFAQFIGLLDADEEEDSKAFIGLKMLLSAWTRMEDEANGPERDKIQDVRLDWGRFARNYMSGL